MNAARGRRSSMAQAQQLGGTELLPATLVEHSQGSVRTVCGVSLEWWEWWETRLSQEQRHELMAFGREPLPVELADSVQRLAGRLPVVDTVRSAAGDLVPQLTDLGARFVGDRTYERDHQDGAALAGELPAALSVYSATPTMPKRIELLHTTDCPNWLAASLRLSIALQVTGRENVQVRVRAVTSPQEAERTGFTGSPMILFDGVDPFDSPGSAVGLSCRLYRDGDDVVDAPTVGQLVDALLACERN